MRSSSGVVLLIISGCLFGVFVANVTLGAAGKAVFLTDIHELLILFASCGFFVAATLRMERQRQLAASAAQQKGN